MMRLFAGELGQGAGQSDEDGIEDVNGSIWGGGRRGGRTAAEGDENEGLGNGSERPTARGRWKVHPSTEGRRTPPQSVNL